MHLLAGESSEKTLRSIARFKKIAFFLCTLFLLPKFSDAQQQLRFEHIGREQGLSYSHVRCIHQDSRGFMWIGTLEGLNRYDGYEFTVFKNNENPHSIGHNYIIDIQEDSQGNLWIATLDGGLNKFDREKEQFVQYTAKPGLAGYLSSNAVQSIHIDKDDNLWVGAYSDYEPGLGEERDGVGGLNFFDRKNNKFIAYSTSKDDSSSIKGQSIEDIIEDYKGNLWIATSKSGLKLFDRETLKFTTYLHHPDDPTSICSNNVTDIFEDRNKNLWIGTDIGLCLFDPETGVFSDISKGRPLPKHKVLSIGEDLSGKIWVGTENGGLLVLDPQQGSWYNYIHEPNNLASLNNNSIWAIYRDNIGDMWLGTYSGGINLYSRGGNKFIHYTQDVANKGLNNNTIFCIREDAEGNLLLATDGGGVNIFNRENGTFTYLMHEDGNPNSICGNHVISVLEDSQKNIWVGTWGKGLTKYNKLKNSYTHYKYNPSDENSISSNYPYYIYEDSQRTVWIATYWGGVNRYDRAKDQFIRYDRSDKSATNTIISDLIQSIAEDHDGNLWFGTVGGGLDMLNRRTGEFIHYQTDSANNKAISNDVVTSILIDSLNNPWVGTADKLNYLDRKTNKFSAFGTENGLVHNYIRGIVDDGKGNLWVSTDGGISKFHVATKAFENFGVADGLQAPEFKTHAYLKSKDGVIFFGGTNGFNEFHPDSIKIDRYEPPLVFTNFQIFNEPVAIGVKGSVLKRSITETNEIELTHRESVISFEFASLNYSKRRTKHYSYILEGFDQKWNNIGAKRTITYTNLKPNKYTLKVRGLNNAEEWSENIAQLIIIVKPAFWTTWWFQTLIVLIIGGITYGLYLYRVRLIHVQKQQLEKQVASRTSELQHLNVELNHHAKRLEKANVEINRQRAEVERLYTDAKDSIRAAEAIQKSILPTTNEIRHFLPDFFVFYKPKDVVGGDFYWFEAIDDKLILAVADCTGHGVSGALMSINGYHLLNKAIYNLEGEITAAALLDQLQKEFAEDLYDKGQDNGMEIALCVISPNEGKLQYSGAGCPLYLLRNQNLIQIKPNFISIGLIGSQKGKFKNHEVALNPDDVIYMFSDGYPDQIGGTGDSKYMYPRFRELLQKIGALHAKDQIHELNQELEQWRGDVEQIDDILVVGFKVPDHL